MANGLTPEEQARLAELQAKFPPVSDESFASLPRGVPEPSMLGGKSAAISAPPEGFLQDLLFRAGSSPVDPVTGSVLPSPADEVRSVMKFALPTAMAVGATAATGGNIAVGAGGAALTSTGIDKAFQMLGLAPESDIIDDIINTTTEFGMDLAAGGAVEIIPAMRRRIATKKAIVEAEKQALAERTGRVGETLGLLNDPAMRRVYQDTLEHEEFYLTSGIFEGGTRYNPATRTFEGSTGEALDVDGLKRNIDIILSRESPESVTNQLTNSLATIDNEWRALREAGTDVPTITSQDWAEGIEDLQNRLARLAESSVTEDSAKQAMTRLGQITEDLNQLGLQEESISPAQLTDTIRNLREGLTILKVFDDPVVAKQSGDFSQFAKVKQDIQVLAGSIGVLKNARDAAIAETINLSPVLNANPNFTVDMISNLDEAFSSLKSLQRGVESRSRQISQSLTAQRPVLDEGVAGQVPVGKFAAATEAAERLITKPFAEAMERRGLASPREASIMQESFDTISELNEIARRRATGPATFPVPGPAGTAARMGAVTALTPDLSLDASEVSASLAQTSSLSQRLQEEAKQIERLEKVSEQYGIQLGDFESVVIDPDDDTVLLDDPIEQQELISLYSDIDSIPHSHIAAQASQFNHPRRENKILPIPKPKKSTTRTPQVRKKKGSSSKPGKYIF